MTDYLLVAMLLIAILALGAILLAPETEKPADRAVPEPEPESQPADRAVPELTALLLDKGFATDVLLLLDAGKIRLRAEEVGFGPYFSADQICIDAMRRVVFTLRSVLGPTHVAGLIERPTEDIGMFSAATARCPHGTDGRKPGARYQNDRRELRCYWCGSLSFCTLCNSCRACGKGSSPDRLEKPPKGKGIFTPL